MLELKAKPYALCLSFLTSEANIVADGVLVVLGYGDHPVVLHPTYSPGTMFHPSSSELTTRERTLYSSELGNNTGQ
jgi:hypothetical protein